MRKILMSGLLLSGVTAAAAAQPVDIAGTPLQRELIKQYRAYMQSEAQEFEIEDSLILQNQLANAAHGTIQPHSLAKTRFVQSPRSELTAQRQRLVQWYGNPQATRGMPATLARAAAAYDCWVEQQEAQPNASHNLQRCRADYYAAAAQLPPPPMVVQPPQSITTREEVAALATVYFAFDSADLTTDTRSILDELRRQLTTATQANVVIVGHADRAGPAGYNQRLSAQRAQTVADYLALPPHRYRLTSRAAGESRPVVPTADGVANQANRRVTVEVDAERTTTRPNP